MCSQFFRSPFGFCLYVVVVVPMVLQVLVNGSLVSSGSRAFRLLTMAFLFVDRTPAFGRLFGIHAVMRSFGGCVSGDRAILPR